MCRRGRANGTQCFVAQALLYRSQACPWVVPQPCPPLFEICNMKGRRFRRIQFIPSQRHCHWDSAAGARRVRRHRSGLAVIAQIIEIDAILPRCLGHFGHVKIRFLLFHVENHTMSEIFDYRPFMFRLDGHDHVKSFSAGALQKAFQAKLLEPAAQVACSLPPASANRLPRSGSRSKTMRSG